MSSIFLRLSNRIDSVSLDALKSVVSLDVEIVGQLGLAYKILLYQRPNRVVLLGRNIKDVICCSN